MPKKSRDKTDKPKKADGRKPGLLPKYVAGVKIPKALREQGHHLAELARHPLVADLLAAGLVALAGTLRDNPKVKAAAGKAKESADDTPPAPPPAEAAPAPKPSAPVKRAATRKAPTPKAAKPAAAKAPTEAKAAPKAPRKPAATPAPRPRKRPVKAPTKPSA